MLKLTHRVPMLILSPQYNLCFEFAAVYNSQANGKQSLGHLGWFTYRDYHKVISHVCFFCMGMFLSCMTRKHTAVSAA